MKEKLFKLLFPKYYEAYQYFKKQLKEIRFKNKIVNKYTDLPAAINHEGEIWEVLFESGSWMGFYDFGVYVAQNGRWLEIFDPTKPLFNHFNEEFLKKPPF